MESGFSSLLTMTMRYQVPEFLLGFFDVLMRVDRAPLHVGVLAHADLPVFGKIRHCNFFETTFVRQEIQNRVRKTVDSGVDPIVVE